LVEGACYKLSGIHHQNEVSFERRTEQRVGQSPMFIENAAPCSKKNLHTRTNYQLPTTNYQLPLHLMAVYFISDLHFGRDGRLTSVERERLFVQWLHEVAADAEAIFIVGDLFDFWFDYKTVVPKGFVRALGAIASVTDSGIPMYFFVGNHDMWVGKYLEQELGMTTFLEPKSFELQGKQIFIGHGDGLGPGDETYKILKKIFRSPTCQWLFERLHPNLGMAIALGWSGHSRDSEPAPDYFLGEDKEWLLTFCAEKSATEPKWDYFVFGHRHLPINYVLSDAKTRYINIGDWLHHQTYGRLVDGQMEILDYGYATPIYMGSLAHKS
jgi:UDP-2,3-diacylglucosamine hydrolase